MTVRGKGGRPDDARRALVLHERAAVVDLIELTLNHGLFAVRAARTLAEAKEILVAWSPHMAVIDMDHDDSARSPHPDPADQAAERLPSPALHRHGPPGKGYRFIPTYSNRGWDGDDGTTEDSRG